MNEKLIVEILYYCMVCDGKISPEEQVLLRQICLLETQMTENEINQVIKTLFEKNETVDDFLKQLRAGERIADSEKVLMLEILIQMILADGILHHQEIVFFKRICQSFAIERKLIQENFPESEEWLDVKIVSYFTNSYIKGKI